MPILSSRLQIDVRWQPDAVRERTELLRALGEEPPRVPSKYFYDERGSRIFEQITTLDAYYLTRTERGLLSRIAPELAERTGAVELVELGSGAADKTLILLDAFATRDRLERYLPLDVDETMVRRTGEKLVARYPGLDVHGLVEDFTRDLVLPEAAGPRLVLFLGSTIGNLGWRGARRFLTRVAAALGPRDHLLLGLDLVKERAVLEAAYNDPGGLTAQFNRNILEVLNRRFGGDFDLASFAHRAFFDSDRSWIEMRLVARRRQTVRLEELELELELAEGEEILTEISAKYRRASARELINAAGLDLIDWHTDPRQRFALALIRKAGSSSSW